MFAKRTDLNYFTARRLGDMAESLGKLARAFDEGASERDSSPGRTGWLPCRPQRPLCAAAAPGAACTRTAGGRTAIICTICLRTFEQNGRVEEGDMPQVFQGCCPRKTDYLSQLNRSLGRATMNLSWKNRFLESRDAVISQFRELSLILEEFSHQIDQARDISEAYGGQLRRLFRRHHMSVDNLLLLEYENMDRGRHTLR